MKIIRMLVFLFVLIAPNLSEKYLTDDEIITAADKILEAIIEASVKAGEEDTQ